MIKIEMQFIQVLWFVINENKLEIQKEKKKVVRETSSTVIIHVN